jgi:hypothetical protein
LCDGHVRNEEKGQAAMPRITLNEVEMLRIRLRIRLNVAAHLSRSPAFFCIRVVEEFGCC